MIRIDLIESKKIISQENNYFMVSVFSTNYFFAIDRPTNLMTHEKYFASMKIKSRPRTRELAQKLDIFNNMRFRKCLQFNHKNGESYRPDKGLTRPPFFIRFLDFFTT